MIPVAKKIKEAPSKSNKFIFLELPKIMISYKYPKGMDRKLTILRWFFKKKNEKTKPLQRTPIACLWQRPTIRTRQK